ncbi:MAG: response regulator transcription factor [Planctomycetales bacterium]
MQASKTRIFVVDDHPLIRDGLMLLINSEKDLEVCGTASGVADAIQKLPQAAPEVIIVDITLRDGTGLDLIQRARQMLPQSKILVISHHDERLYGERALRAGAMGYVNKEQCEETILGAIRTVRAGKRHISEELMQKLLTQAIGQEDAQEPDSVARLTDRELQVFGLIGEGLGTTQIAKKLHLSNHTIDSHRENIRRKLNLKNGHELTHAAVRWKLENENSSSAT